MSKKDEALKLALEALVQWETGCGTTEYLAKVENAVPFIREALAEQPAPMIRGDIRDGLVDDEPAQPAQQQMPNDWFKGMPEEYRRAAWRIKEQPAQQITEAQVEAALKAAHMHSTPESRKDMRRALEAAHGIKENT